MTIQGDRQLVAAIVGLEMANSIHDDQLPALVHACEEDALSVAACAREANRPGVKHPPSLMMWLIRERKHTGLIEPNYTPRPAPAPLARTPEQEIAYAGWQRIWQRIDEGDRMFRQIVMEWCELYPDPTDEQALEVRTTLCALIDEMENDETDE
jgi:hypothetical protein